MKNYLYRGLFVGLFLFIGQIAQAASFRDYSYLDPDKIIPVNLLNEAVAYYDAHLLKITNQRVMSVIDYKQHNSKERFYIIDMESGRVETYLTAHGKNSDPNFDGYATKFSNTPDSNTTSLGFFLTAETYYGSNGYSLRLDGLSTTNSNARKRAIVIHGAEYVAPGPKIGRSYGCPAVEMRYHQDLIDQIKEGSLLYAGLGK